MPIRPSPGSPNVSPTSGVPTSTTVFAVALTKPAALAGASGRVSAAPVKTAANGMPAARPSTIAPAAANHGGSAATSAAVPMPPATSEAWIALRAWRGNARSTQPPSGRDTMPRASTAAAIAAATLLPIPALRSSSSVAQPAITKLTPNESE
jgi:hypothetical protein